MPGLRSLVARRRCSLPTTCIISSESVMCSYPSVPASIPSRKRNSLDESITEETDLTQTKWDLKKLFKVDEKSLETTKENLCHSENDDILPTTTKLPQINGSNSTNVSEKENSSIVHCPTNSCENSLKRDDNKDYNLSSSDFGNKLESDGESSCNSVPPERIVIKMKLLHGSSLSDVTNIAADNSEDSDSIRKSDINYDHGNTSLMKTRWTIDAILNQPVSTYKLESENSVEKMSDVGYRESEEMVSPTPSCDTSKPLECSEIKEHSSLNEVGVTSNCRDEHQENPPVETVSPTTSLCNKNINDCSKIEQGAVLSSYLSDIARLSDTRRPSNSSDISEESTLSENSSVSTQSGSSSDSSVKSCSIVIKRLENSNSYSCFRSSKSKSKRFHDKFHLSRTVYMKKGKSIPFLCIPKHLFYKSKSDFLPCSVTLCDIFSNYPFTTEICPRCMNNYNLSNDLLVNIFSKTITLQCLVCKWLVVRSLKMKHINVYSS